MSFLMFLGCGCAVNYVAEIDYKTHGIYMTTSDQVRVDGKALAASPAYLMKVEKWGLRILGVIPVGSAALRDTVNLLADEAKNLDVDAVVSLRFETYKAAFPWCLLNWYTSTTVTGMGMRTENKESSVPDLLKKR
jgi:hypothetical protein